MPKTKEEVGRSGKGRRRDEDATTRLRRRYAKRRDDETRNTLVEKYLPLVRYQAERLKAKFPNCVDLNDLLSAGVLGLMDAIEKFDLDRGVKFQTFCMLRIRGAIFDELRAVDWVPRLVRARSAQLARARQNLEGELARAPTDAEIAEGMNLSLAEYRELVRENEIHALIPIEGATDEGEGERGGLCLEMMEDKRQLTPAGLLERREIREHAVRGLSEKEKLVIVMYYYDEFTMKEIGAVLGLSESRVCQIHAQALKVLRERFEALERTQGAGSML